MAVSTYYLGLDLGQAQQPSALAVVERTESAGEWDAVAMAARKQVRVAVRYLQRAPAGATYAEMIGSVRRVLEQTKAERGAQLVADVTGVGGPVLGMLQRAGLEAEITPVVVTQGRRESGDGELRLVPKRDVILNLQVMVQLGELQMAAKMKDAEGLVREMAEMRVGEQGEWREGQRDDLVLAVGLACWKLKRDYPGDGEEYWGVGRLGIWEMLL